MVRASYALGAARVGTITSCLFRLLAWGFTLRKELAEYLAGADASRPCWLAVGRFSRLMGRQWFTTPNNTGVKYPVKKSIFAHKRASVSSHKDGQQMLPASSHFSLHIISG